MFSMSKIGEDMCLSARMPSVDKVDKSQYPPLFGSIRVTDLGSVTPLLSSNPPY